MRPGTNTIIVSLAALTAALVLWPRSAQADDDLPKAVGMTFLKAESKAWIKSWLDSHPPIAGVPNFGAKTIFVLELLIAAEEYSKADTDKARFHAAGDGAIAFVAYSYSATPAVGLIVTAIYICAQIIESSVSGSYQEAMLAIERDILLTEARRQDLVFRLNLARAYHVMGLVDATRLLMQQSSDLELQVAADCTARAGDYASLGHCMDLVTQGVAVRESLVTALNGLLALPDADLNLLDTSPTPGAAPIPPLRQRLMNARDQAAQNLAALKTVYDPMASNFAKLAANYLVIEATADEERRDIASSVQATCLVEHTKLLQTGGTEVARLAAAGHDLLTRSRTPALLAATDAARAEAQAYLAEYIQRKLTCDNIGRDQNLPILVELVRSRLADLEAR